MKEGCTDHPLRESNFDLLRIVSCIAVVFIHVSAQYKTAITDDSVFGVLLSEYIPITLVYNTLSRFAVPCFVMLAGAFALSNEKNSNYKNYYTTTFKSIGIPVFVFSMLYTLYNILVSFYGNWRKNELGISVLISPLKAWLAGKPYYHLWYMYMMIFIYLLVPILIKWKNDISVKTYRQIVYLLMIVTILGGWTSTYALSWSIGNAVSYLGYFLIGDIIREITIQKKNNVRGICCIISGVCGEILVTLIQYSHSIRGLSEYDETYTIVGG